MGEDHITTAEPHSIGAVLIGDCGDAAGRVEQSDSDPAVPDQLRDLVQRRGFALGPVLKAGSNAPLARRNADIDVNLGTILDGREAPEEVGARFLRKLQPSHGSHTDPCRGAGYHHESKIWESL